MLTESIQGNCCAIMARAEYVQLARKLCDHYGVLLIIDEVKTGFRVGKGGMQGIMGVTPDLTTFAKAVANGSRGLDARVMAGLDPERHGLSFHPALPTTILGPDPLTVTRAATTGPDAAAWAALYAKPSTFARVLPPSVP